MDAQTLSSVLGLLFFFTGGVCLQGNLVPFCLGRGINRCAWCSFALFCISAAAYLYVSFVAFDIAPTTIPVSVSTFIISLLAVSIILAVMGVARTARGHPVPLE